MRKETLMQIHDSSSRDYSQWMAAVAKKKQAYPDLNLVIRHDIDFDIQMARKMLEIEHKHGLNSVIYVDVRSPSYLMADIVALHKDFTPHGFKFGIHINVAYDHDGEDACWQAYLNDLQLLRENGIEPHSCVGHYYSERMAPIPQYDNVAVELKSGQNHDVYATPLPFIRACLSGQHVRLGDGGGSIAQDVSTWIDSLNGKFDAYLSFHPVHFRSDGNGNVVYAKRLCIPKLITEQEIEQAQDGVLSKLPPYFSTHVRNKFYLSYTLRVLNDILNHEYRKLIRIVDAGCGFGLLGAYLMWRHNAKYIGIDLEQKFINVGHEFYRSLGYAADLRVDDLYSTDIRGDVLVHLAYEDCEVDYDYLLSICKNYSWVIITIVSKEMLESAKRRGKDYVYIDHEKFERTYGQFFEIPFKARAEGGRILYCLRQKK